MPLGSKFKTKRAINDTITENVSSQKILRICVDNNLTGHTQVHNVKSKLSSKIALLKKNSYFWTDDTFSLQATDKLYETNIYGIHFQLT
jgi:hypothetical protein